MSKFDKHFKKYEAEGVNYLRENIPELQKIESLDELQDLKFIKEDYVGAKITGIPNLSYTSIIMLWYEAKAPELFPNIEQKLINKKVVQKKNLLYKSKTMRKESEDYHTTHIGFYENQLQIVLSLRK
ncbi:MAG: hypothetical protein ABIB43_04625 [archaeon]